MLFVGINSTCLSLAARARHYRHAHCEGIAMLATYCSEKDIDAISLGQTVWVPFVILVCGRIANGQPGFAWLEFLFLALLALALPMMTWTLYRLVQRLF